MLLTLDANKNTLEQAKFVETATGTVAIRTVLAGGLVPKVYDSVTASYPDAVTEVYAYTLNANPVGTVTVTYTDSTKESLASAVRT